jgi:hypothetical protein
MNLLSGGCLAPGHLARQKFWHIRGPRFFTLPNVFSTGDTLPVPVGASFPVF